MPKLEDTEVSPKVTVRVEGRVPDKRQDLNYLKPMPELIEKSGLKPADIKRLKESVRERMLNGMQAAQDMGRPTSFKGIPTIGKLARQRTIAFMKKPRTPEERGIWECLRGEDGLPVQDVTGTIISYTVWN